MTKTDAKKETQTEFDWHAYYADGKAKLKSYIESDPAIWDRWTKSDKRYMLVTKISVTEHDFSKPPGCTTKNFDARISSDSIDDLYNIWNDFLVKRYYDATIQHFIVDTKDRKVVEFVSVCM